MARRGAYSLNKPEHPIACCRDEWQAGMGWKTLAAFFLTGGFFTSRFQTFEYTIASERVSDYFESATELIEVYQIVFGHDGYDFIQRCRT
jgi:hypothetical protein